MKNETARQEIESLDYYLQNHTDDYSEESHTAMMMAIKALEQQLSEDCISRQAVIDHICEDKECYKEECKGRTLKRCYDLQWVFDLPSVKPKYTDEEIDKAQAVEQAYVDKMVELAVAETKRPKGKWVLSGGYWRCSRCKEKALLKFDKSNGGCKEYMPIKSNYCPNCGAEMSGGGEE